MIDKELKRLIEENAMSFSTLDGDGKIHTIAVGFAKVVNERQLVITDNYMSKTINNINRDSRVTLAVWSRNWKDKCTGYEMRGFAEYFMEGVWHNFVKELKENRGEPCKGAILVTVKEKKKLA